MAVALILVVLVIALFLRRLWATVIPGVTIPVSIAATLVAMYFLDFSLDNISLMALTIAIGFVIDDAVIIIENIIRLIQEGEQPIDAALKGTRQMGFTVVSITFALIAGLVPVLFMPDIVGRLFREFGVTLVVAIVASAIVSLTLTPMLCGQLLGRARPAEPGRISRFCGHVIDRVVDWYVAEPRLGTALPLGHAARRGRADRGDDCVVRKLTQRFFADPGHRHFADQDRDTLQHVVRSYGGITAIGRFADRGGSSCGKRFLGDRSWGHERRHDADKSKAAERS